MKKRSRGKKENNPPEGYLTITVKPPKGNVKNPSGGTIERRRVASRGEI